MAGSGSGRKSTDGRRVSVLCAAVRGEAQEDKGLRRRTLEGDGGPRYRDAGDMLDVCLGNRMMHQDGAWDSGLDCTGGLWTAILPQPLSVLGVSDPTSQTWLWESAAALPPPSLSDLYSQPTKAPFKVA